MALWPAGMLHARLCSQAARLPLPVKCLDFATAKQRYRRRSFSEVVSHVSSAWVYWIIPEGSLQHSKVAPSRVVQSCGAVAPSAGH